MRGADSIHTLPMRLAILRFLRMRPLVRFRKTVLLGGGGVGGVIPTASRLLFCRIGRCCAGVVFPLARAVAMAAVG